MPEVAVAPAHPGGEQAQVALAVGPSRKMATAGAAIDLAAVHKMENDRGIVSEPFHIGRAGKLLRAAKACTTAGAGLTVVAGSTPAGGGCVRTLLAAGSLLTRFGVFDVGMASARNPSAP